MAGMDVELERFKTEISLCAYAQEALGYDLLKKESSKSSIVLKNGSDKIIVARDTDGHDIYFNVNDAGDSGSIIDFVQKRTSLNLGGVRKELRSWIPGGESSARYAQARQARPVNAPKQRMEIIRLWSQMPVYSGHYLSKERKLNSDIITAFGVRQDERGNACFGHFDGSGIVGWEKKNRGFTGFAAGGQRGFFHAQLDDGPISSIVLAEAAIDLLSYAQLNHQNGAMYISTGGSGLNPLQISMLQKAMEKYRARLIVASDADAAGDVMAEKMHDLAAMAGAVVERARPPRGKDWNDVLVDGR